MKSVVICGSSRFASEIREFAKNLQNLGVVVYEPHLYRASGGVWDNIADFDKRFVASGLTHDHFYKIRMADVVYVLNQHIPRGLPRGFLTKGKFENRRFSSV